MRTRVYIDGFNLYYGIIRRHGLQWLNLEQFCERLNLGIPAERIIYCTAMVSSTPDDQDKASRQSTYHRALKIACPSVEVVLGTFTQHKKMQPIAGCVNAPTCAVKVLVRNEKGSDVNLGARLVHDAHTGTFDRAIVVSGDSDLVEPIRIVAKEIGKDVWVRNPYWRQSKELMSVATNYAPILPAVLRKSQFPDSITDGQKAVSKPPAWSQQAAQLKKSSIFTANCTQGGCQNQVEFIRYQ